MFSFKSTLEFEVQLLKCPSLRSVRERSQILSTLLLDSPTQLSDTARSFDFTHLVLPRRLKDKLILALLSWYMTEEIGILIRLDLEQYWGEELKEVGTVVLTSKEFCLAWFCIQEKFNENDFFGNYLSKSRVNTILRNLRFRTLSSRKVKRYTGYCRGYQEARRTGSTSIPPELQPGTISSEELLQQRVEASQRLELLRYKLRNFLDSA